MSWTPVQVGGLYKALDAVATAPLREDGADWAQVLDRRLSNYDRVAALVQACDRLAPGVATRWSRRLLGERRLPLAGRCRLYAFGSGATVFRIEGGAQQLILKIYRRTLGQKGQRLLALARWFRQKYATVCGWYAAGDLTILPSSYLILHAPLLATPAVGMVQPFVAQEMKDLFLDFTDGDLCSLMAADARLGTQLRFFCSRTLAVARREGLCLDFVGRDNVSLLKQADGAWTLAILDYGIFDLAQKRASAPQAYEQVMARMARMEELLKVSERRTPGAVAGGSSVRQG